ncbi:hypothetical protein OC842_007013 [Tilletia horrida]|uniref:Uncharacterized protein n=1 Tax=Tilletia horrida TaxID=155126 RepID=A0AAN6G4H0_9BASI|nr:hypothetical protein OC842_007013 [Tilletia horrida]
MQFQSFLTLALSLFSAGSALASTHDGNRFVRRHHNAIEAAVRDMAAEHSANVLKYKRGSGPSPVTFTCRTLVLKDITDDLTNKQVAQLVNYTNNQVLNNLNPGMTMFDVNYFNNGGASKNFSSIVGRWRADTGYWTSGHAPSNPDNGGGGGGGGGDSGGGSSFWDDFADWLFGKRDLSSDSHFERRAGSDGTDTTWYFSPITQEEVDENGLTQAQVCLDVTQAALTNLQKGSCSYATFDAHGTMNDGGEVQVSIQQATEITTTVSTEQTTSSGQSLGGSVTVGFEAGFEEGFVAKASTSATISTEAHIDVSNTQGTETSTSSSLTNTVQITFQQAANQSCYVQLTQENCNSKLRLVTPITLTGQLHLQSSPYCQYNLDANGNCKNDLLIDLQTAMAGFKTDAVIVQYIDAALTSTGTYKQQCVNGSDAESPFQPPSTSTNVTTADPASATLTVYGHTATAYALTATVAEKTETVQVMTNTVTPTMTVYEHTEDVATATVYPKTRTVTANNAKHITVTSTRRPPAHTHVDHTTVYKGVRTVTNVPTTTVTKRVSQTLKPTRCRRSMDDDEEEADVFARSEPTAAPQLARRDEGTTSAAAAAVATASADASATVTYAATTTLSDATTTFTDPIHPTTVTASGSTTTVTEAVSGTKTMPAVTTTDTTNTQYRFVTATGVRTKIVTRVTQTVTVRRPARTSTVLATVTKAASTRTVQGSATVTVKKTRTVTVTPHCTRHS